MKNLSLNSKENQSALPWLLLAIVAMAGAFLRLFQLGVESYWLDEIATVYVGQNSVGYMLSHWNFDTPPFFFILFHFWEKAFGLSEIATRSFSAIAGILSILLLYLIGRRLFNWKVALMSAVFLAVSESEIFYSQETRFYGWLGLLTLVSVYTFIRSIQDGKKAAYLVLGLVNALLFFTHAFGCFVILAEGLYFLIYWKKYKVAHLIWFLGQCITALILGSALLLSQSWENGILNTAQSIVKWIPKPSAFSILKTLYQFVFPLREGRPWWNLALSLGVGGLFVAAGAVIYWLKTNQKTNKTLKQQVNSILEWGESTPTLVFLLIWLFIPLIIPFLLSLVSNPIYLDRYVSEAAPALMLLLAFGIYKMRGLVPEWVVMVGLLIFIVPGLVNYYAKDINEEWKEVARDIQQNLAPGDVVIIAPDQDGYETRLIKWYATASLPECSIDANITDEAAIGKALASCVNGYQRFWLVMRGPTDLMKSFISAYMPANEPAYQEVEQSDYTGIQVNVYMIQTTK